LGLCYVVTRDVCVLYAGCDQFFYSHQKPLGAPLLNAFFFFYFLWCLVSSWHL